MHFSRTRRRLPAPQVSRHLKALSEAGYVTVSKTASSERSDARRVAWVRLTPAGRQALDGHMAALEQIVDGSAAAHDGSSG